MVELGLTKQESELVLSALSTIANDLQNSYRYSSGSKEDDKNARIMFNIMERIRFQEEE